MSAWADLVVARLALHSIQFTLVALAAGTIAVLLRRRSAAGRHAIWAGALLAALALPLASALLPSWQVLPAALVGGTSAAHPSAGAPARAPGQTGSASRESAASLAGIERHADSGGAAGGAAPAAGELAARTRTAALPLLLLGLYLLGSAATGSRLLVGLVRVRRLHARSRPARVGASLGWPARVSRGRAVAVRTSDEIASPITFGVLHPVVLVPTGLASSPGTIGRNALMHEYAHVDRLDWLPHLLGRLVLCLYWFHPLAWLAARELMLESERACDEAVLRSGTAAPDYAAQLVAWTRRARHARCADPAIALSRGPQLQQRIRSILDETLDRNPMSPFRIRLLTTLVVAIGTLAATVAPAAVPLPAGAATLSESPQRRGATGEPELTTLMRAAARGDVGEVRDLLAAGRDANESVPGLGTPLMHAAAGAHVQVVRLLLEAGAEPDFIERRPDRHIDLYRTPLACAASSGSSEVVRLLLDAGAPVDLLVAGDPTALMVAARAGHESVVRLLLERGGDADRRVPGDGTPLIAAARAGNLAIARWLLEAGADVNGSVPGDGNALIAAVDRGDIDLVQFLLDNGADPRASVPGDESALVRAAEREDTALLRLLMDTR